MGQDYSGSVIVGRDKGEIILKSTTLPLVFAPSGNGNWSSAQTVWVESIIDYIDEGSLGHDNQTFNVWISQASEINQENSLYDNFSLVKSNISVNSIGAFQDNLTLSLIHI